MEMIIQPQYITNTEGKTISAILPIEQYNEILAIIESYEKEEMIEDIKAYKKVKSEPAEYESFDDVVKRILNNGKQ